MTLFVLISLVLLAWPAVPAQAATIRVDDSGSVVSQGVVPMRWKQLVPGRGADHTVEASLRVALRLNLARWVNQPVRVYMALAPAAGEPIYASWRTQGRLLPGSLRSGTRVLVFDGVTPSPSLEETLDLSLKTDGRALVYPQSLQFYFEVDTP
ncbi:MAG: hypothetical protein B7Y54_01755 [Polaromonas sp. 35-63-240]|uniref:hypothetical protein n=1 Tax=Polaromonas sp. TaxID=1869339 RepID=UPI000BC9F1E8|nr:hypothetical protein [Polaromonas sp.]OYY53752.1 MAG: hypothetical protein B7Y54_01755 [Polaromonas sp. 35-63-240]OYZ01531.1 MAG: hypothetical protein B7Y42_03345 [Polaromonas sp. 28-63-22]